MKLGGIVSRRLSLVNIKEAIVRIRFHGIRPHW